MSERQVWIVAMILSEDFLVSLFAFRGTLTRARRALGGARSTRARGSLRFVDERAERALEFVKSTRSTASHILTILQRIPGTFSVCKKCAKASLRA